MLTKIIRSTKYLSNQTLCIGITATILIVIYLAFQFTSVDMNSNKSVNNEEVREQKKSSATFDWKKADLWKREIPENINQEGKLQEGNELTEKNREIQVPKLINTIIRTV